MIDSIIICFKIILLNFLIMRSLFTQLTIHYPHVPSLPQNPHHNINHLYLFLFILIFIFLIILYFILHAEFFLMNFSFKFEYFA